MMQAAWHGGGASSAGSRPRHNARAAALSPEIEGSDTKPRPPGNVLIVEDEYFAALVSESALLDAGFAVCGVASTAEEAIAMAGSKRPDIVLMDIRLSGVRDGIDAAEEILDQFGIPSLFATAQADAGTRRRGEQLHPLGWLLKPFAPDELVAKVGAAVALARQRRSGS